MLILKTGPFAGDVDFSSARSILAASRTILNKDEQPPYVYAAATTALLGAILALTANKSSDEARALARTVEDIAERWEPLISKATGIPP